MATGAALAAGAALAPQMAHAATITVDSLADAIAPVTDSQCTLREAITNANDDAATFADCVAGSGADTIDFSVTGTIVQDTDAFIVTDDLTITGPGTAQLTVQGSNSIPVTFLVPSASGVGNFAMSGLTITGGGGVSIDVSDAAVTLDDLALTSGVGGVSISTHNDVSITNTSISGNIGYATGVHAYLYGTGDVTVDNVTITNNNSIQLGGLYFYAPASAVIQNCVISGNTVGSGEDQDAMIEIASAVGAVTIRDTTVSGNTSSGLGEGAVFILYSDNVSIADTTISGNTNATGPGGGLNLYLSSVTLENSTIANNQSTGDVGLGGGITAFAADLTMRLSTVSGNSASNAGGNLFAYYGNVTLENSIVANGTAPIGPDIVGSVTANYSLIEDTTDAAIAGANNITGQDPLLGPLQNNGGTTETMKPAATSPAVNAGDPAFTPPPSTDQRGLARPVGRVDMGAVELQSGTVALSSTVYSVNENGGTLLVTVTRTGGADGAASVNYATSDGTAANGADYTPASGTLNWADGDTTPKTFSVTILDDTTDEPDETFNITLSAPVNATLGTNAAVATIVDDDVLPSEADLSVTKTAATGGPYTVGDQVTFDIQVSNAGPAAATNVTVDDVLPSGLTFVSATASAGSCSGTTTVTCNVGTLNSGENATIQLTVQITQAGSITNTATAESDVVDPTPASGSATINAAAAATTQIPTLSEWMLLALASALAAAAALKMRQ